MANTIATGSCVKEFRVNERGEHIKSVIRVRKVYTLCIVIEFQLMSSLSISVFCFFLFQNNYEPRAKEF